MNDAVVSGTEPSDADQILDSPAPLDRESAGADALELRVVLAGGPGVDFQICVAQEGRVVALGSTDGEGRYRAPGMDGPVTVSAWREDVWRVSETFPSGVGSHELRVDADSRVWGEVYVDGERPRDPLVLTLTPNVPGDVLGLREAERACAIPVDLRTTTDGTGAFAFPGLPHEWKGALRWEAGYTLEGSGAGLSRSTYLESVPRRITLRLAIKEVVRGRVVRATGEPVPRAFVRTSWSLGDRFQEPVGRADEQGVFVFDVPHRSLQSLTLSVALPNGAGMKSSRLTPPGASAGPLWDVGDVAVGDTRSVLVKVVDEQHDPIPGAAVKAAAESDLPHFQGGVTDDGGSCALDIPLGLRVLRAVAPRYEPQEFVVPATLDEVVVQLAPATLLECFLLGNADGCTVLLQSADPLFDGRWRPDREALLPGTREVGSFQSRSGGTVTFSPEGGAVRLSGIQAGLPFSLSVLDSSKIPIVDVAVDPLDPGEQRTVELDVGSGASSISGTVVDEEDRRVAGAKVFLIGDQSTQYSRGRSDADGRFAFEDLRSPRARIVTTHPDYAPSVTPLQQGHLDGDPLRVVLTQGRDVSVHVVDDLGEPIPGCTVLAFVDGIPWELTSQSVAGSPGEYTLPRLPRIGGRIVVAKGSATQEEPLSAEAAEVHFEISRGATVLVKIGAAVTFPTEKVCRIVAIAPGDDRPQAIEGLGLVDEVAGLSATFDHLEPGEWSFALQVQSFEDGAERWSSLNAATILVAERGRVYSVAIE